jgi:hypothetical protein
MEQDETPKRKISKWAIGAGILGAVAVTVGVTAYYVKTRRNKELQVQRYKQEEEEESFFGRMGRYWRTTVDTFNVLKTYIPSYNKKNSPLVTSAQAKKREVILQEPDGDW